MNSILIPTDYQYDTLHALEMTLKKGETSDVQVVLLSFTPAPDSITDYLSTPSRSSENVDRKKLMEEWRTMTSLIDDRIQLREHHQYGASVALIEQIIERYEVDELIVPYSFQKSESIIHLTAMNVFQKSKYKITWMPEQNSVRTLTGEELKGELVER